MPATSNLVIKSSWAHKVSNNLCFFTLAALAFSCSADKKENLPGYSGSWGEVVVVMSRQQWQQQAGDAIYRELAAPHLGMPSEEPSHTVIHISADKFQSVIRTHRCILIPEISREKYAFAPAQLKISRSVWARGQLVVHITAGNEDTLIAGIKRYGPRLRELFTDVEINRRINRNAEFGPVWLRDSVKNAYAVDMHFQKDFTPVSVRNGVMWVRLERERTQGGFQHQVSQGVVLFTLPYRAYNQLLDNAVMDVADSVLALHIQGAVSGSFMKIDRLNVEPVQREINQMGNYAREVRGIWRMEKNFFGGPFYLLATLDEQRQRIIYVFAYVYAPQFEKRDYLQEVEAMARSLKPV